ncbi:hypothetical protein FRB94_003025 [Tulasnella sp. JGI-2019a]|nr:hypothetical protein FRB94_003025 [Tulasnella sp. JGI-2019a]
MRALDIPEIPSQVLDLMGESDKFASALVCQTWSSVALDAIWRDLDELIALLYLIGDVTTIYNFKTRFPRTRQHVEFSQSLEGTDWSRFDSYAARVISLNWDSKGLSFSPTVFGQIAAARPGSKPLLPNLLSIKWAAHYDVDTDHMLHFLSQSVTFLHIQYRDTCTASHVTALMSNLATLAPEVSELTIECSFRVDRVDEALSSWIESLKKLRKVTLPRCFGSPRIVKALGSLGGLESVSGDVKPSETTEHADVILGTYWSLPSNAFQKLRFIDFDATLAQAVELFSGPPPPDLRGLWLAVIGPATNAIIQTFFSALVTWCTDLEELSLNLVSTVTESRERIRFKTLDPLLQLRKLQKLQILHDLSIYLATDNVEAMSLAWPCLVQLSLRGGYREEVSRTSFSILESFAIKFPYIQRLAISLHIDRDAGVVDSVPATFTNLRELHLDTSSIREQQLLPVATLLSLICPPGVEILFGMTKWHQEALRQKRFHAIGVHDTGLIWRRIANGVRSYHRVHQSDRNPEMTATYFRYWFASQS